MNWYKKAQQSFQNVFVDMSVYIQSLRQKIDDTYDFILDEKDRLSNFRLDQNTINSFRQFGIPENLIQSAQNAINTKDSSALNQAWWQIYDWSRKDYDRKDNEAKNIPDHNQRYETWKRNYAVWEKIRKLIKHLQDYVDVLMRQAPDYKETTKEDLEQHTQEVIQQTKENMLNIAQNIQGAINRIPGWHGSKIKVKARDIGKEDDANLPQTSASIEFEGEQDFEPNFTYFTDGDRIDIDDVLEAGDADFFTNDATQSDYFNLIKELRNPGSSQSGGKILTLYTARPVRDRQVFLDAKTVPSNLFLTSNYNAAEGIAVELAGQDKIRDVWKIRIDSRYLIQTLDAPTEKQYQVVGDAEVPVKSMTLLSPGE